MKKVSKVKTVTGDGTWNTKTGDLMYRYNYVMEDGAELKASHKSEGKFKEGDEVEYEITRTHETYGASGTVGKPNTGGGGFSPGGKKGSNASFALSYSKDIAVAMLNNGGEISTDQILAVASKFNTWLNEH